MNKIYTGVAVLALATMAGCADMDRQDRDMAIGAGTGAAAGAILTGGSAVGTVGGAAVGGVIGNEVGKDRHDRYYDGR